MNAAEYLMCEMELTGSRIFFDKRVRRDHRMLAGKNGAMVVIKNGLSIAREHWALIKAQIKQEWYQRFGHLLEDCTEIPDGYRIFCLRRMEHEALMRAVPLEKLKEAIINGESKEEIDDQFCVPSEVIERAISLYERKGWFFYG